jgi:Putative transmembrane protein (PGPGW)
LLVIALGLAILAGEFAWARNLLDRVKQQAAKLRQPKSPPGRHDTPGS